MTGRKYIKPPARVAGKVYRMGLRSILSIRSSASRKSERVSYTIASIRSKRFDSSHLEFLQTRIHIPHRRVHNAHRQIQSIKAREYSFFKGALAVHRICVLVAHDCDYPTTPDFLQAVEFAWKITLNSKFG